MPKVHTHEEARDAFKRARKDKPGLQDSAYRREAARMLDMDLKEYTKLWKNPPKVKPQPLPPIEPLPPGPNFFIPQPKTILPPLPPVMPHVPPPPVMPTVPTPWFLSHEEARAAFRAARKLEPEMSEAAIRRLAAESLNVDYKTYLKAWKKPTPNAVVPKVNPQLVPNTHPKELGWRVKRSDPNRVGRADTTASAGDDMYGINPNWSGNDPLWQNNCTSCTSSLEMGWRDYEVTAHPMMGQSLNSVYKAWNIGCEDQLGVPHWRLVELRKPENSWMRFFPQDFAVSRIDAVCAALPDGARGFATVVWADGNGAHIWNWRKINGRIVHFDAQNNRMLNGAENYLNRSNGRINMARVDHLPTPKKADLEFFVSNKKGVIRKYESPYEIRAREAQERSAARIAEYKRQQAIEAAKEVELAKREAEWLAREVKRKADEAEWLKAEKARRAAQDARVKKAREERAARDLAKKKPWDWDIHKILDLRHDEPMARAINLPTRKISAAAQKAWMVGRNDGWNPFSPFIRRGMGRHLDLEAHMPKNWASHTDARFRPTVQQENDWGGEFIRAINAEKDTQPILFRGMDVDSMNLKMGEEFDMLPSSWSGHPSNAKAYGDTMIVMKDSYGVTLNEARWNLNDQEVVAGGRLRVIGMKKVKVKIRERAYESKPPYGVIEKIVEKEFNLVEVQQVRRLP